MKKVFLMVLMVIMVSCASASPKAGKISIEGNKIIYNGEFFAELRYLRTVHGNTGSVKHRGLAIYYYHSKKEVWIYPREGWNVLDDKRDYSLGEIDAIWRKGGGGVVPGHHPVEKFTVMYAWCFDVKISDDGKYIYYKTPGRFFDSSHKYAIEYPEVDEQK